MRLKIAAAEYPLRAYGKIRRGKSVLPLIPTDRFSFSYRQVGIKGSGFVYSLRLSFSFWFNKFAFGNAGILDC